MANAAGYNVRQSDFSPSKSQGVEGQVKYWNRQLELRRADVLDAISAKSDERLLIATRQVKQVEAKLRELAKLSNLQAEN